MSEHLYPTLVVDGSLSTPAVDNCSTLQRQITSELDKYLQEATYLIVNMDFAREDHVNMLSWK